MATKRLLLGLLGAPIAHSAAPAMHEAAAATLGLDARYHLIEVAGADRPTLARMLDGVRLLGFSGINVTYPYKEAVVPLLDDLSPDARGAGAVNTIIVSGDRLIGHNTDLSGFARLATEQKLPLGGPVAIIGAGGVGKAIGFALKGLGARDLRIADIDPARASHLADALDGATVAGIEDAVTDAIGVVNATPVGMTPNTDSPVSVHLIRPSHWVADAVYAPLWTPLLKGAHARGARVITGRELAIAQAVDAFRLFTGHGAPAAAMEAAFDRVIAARRSDPLAA